MNTLIDSNMDIKHRYALLIKNLRSFLSQQEITEVIKAVNNNVNINQSTISSWERGSVNFMSQYQAVGAIGKIFGFDTLDSFKELLSNSGRYNNLLIKNTSSYWGIKVKSYLLQEKELVDLLHQLTIFNTSSISNLTLGDEMRWVRLNRISAFRFSRFLRHLRGSFSQLAFADFINSSFPLKDIELSQYWVSTWEKGKKANQILPSHVCETFSTLAGIPYDEFLVYLDGHESENVIRFYNRSLPCNQLVLLGKSLSMPEREEIQAFLVEMIQQQENKPADLNPLQKMIVKYLQETGKTWDDLLPCVEPYGLNKSDIKQIKSGKLIPLEKIKRLWAAIASPDGTTYFNRELWNQAVEQTFKQSVA